MSVTIEETLKLSRLLDSDSARLDVELLLCHVLACERIYLRTWSDKVLSSQELDEFEVLFRRRQKGEPIAHLLGSRSFWTLELSVTPDTLIPRPDTEILVEHALSLDLPDDADVLDLGTGTGAIALSLATEKPHWHITATDVFPHVVELAAGNALKNQVQHVRFICSAWFDAIPASRFNLIVSNPPYIDSEDPHLVEGDVRFEPTSALVAGNQGLADIQHIVQEAKSYLHHSGWLILEHGYQQADAVRTLFNNAGYTHVQTLKDYAQLDRMTVGQVMSAK